MSEIRLGFSIIPFLIHDCFYAVKFWGEVLNIFSLDHLPMGSTWIIHLNQRLGTTAVSSNERKEDRPAGGMLMVTRVFPAPGFSLNNMRLMHISYTLSVSYLSFFHLESHWCGHPHGFAGYTDMLAA